MQKAGIGIPLVSFFTRLLRQAVPPQQLLCKLTASSQLVLGAFIFLSLALSHHSLHCFCWKGRNLQSPNCSADSYPALGDSFCSHKPVRG